MQDVLRESPARPGPPAAAMAACDLAAPTWPLDRMIAVNPFWELRDRPADEVAARLAALGGIQMLAPEALIRSFHPEPSAEAAGSGPDRDPGHWLNVSDHVDALRDLSTRMSWHDEIIDQISRFCAAAFEPTNPQAPVAGDLYRRWLDTTRADRGIAILMGEPALARQFEQLAADRDELLATAFDELEVDSSVIGPYAHALLLDVNGWASWIAYLRWQGRLSGEPTDLTPDLLAIRVAWELALWRHVRCVDERAFHQVLFRWRKQQAELPTLIAAQREAQRPAWQAHRAAERAFQARLGERLAVPSPAIGAAPALQAVFCIDVRSEVVRRHLEAQDPTIQTLGFAGFFGLPVALRETGSPVRTPRLPGLLTPALEVSEADDPADDRGRQARARWNELGDAPPAMFTLVETLGPAFAYRLLRETLAKAPAESTNTGASLTLQRDGQALAVAERAELVAGILHAMGLETHFAPTVLLVGHGSSTCNNAHASSLACGACGGQSGEPNVRILAALLNDPAVRAELGERGITIPPGTRFVPALHDTTTDEVTVLDGSLGEQARGWLDAASAATRRERAASFGLTEGGDRELAAAARRRARDWSEVRPEWGLAGNAAFVVAPRARTRGVDLGGRAFLHDYRWQDDVDGSVLELILTAPMVVTHWINMQYNASVADNRRLGSGSKLLHNVVGGHLGVIEGHGGDLRIGLPIQSLHDGERWAHTPLRLSVYVCAPREAIAAVYEGHETVRHLVDNEWLYLFRLPDGAGPAERLYRGAWGASDVGEAEPGDARAPACEAPA